MCLMYNELPIMHVDMSGDDCNLDDQMQESMTDSKAVSASKCISMLQSLTDLIFKAVYKHRW